MFRDFNEKTKRNEKNKEVIWAQVSRQNKSSRFISRLVTRRENATFTEKPIKKRRRRRRHKWGQSLMYELSCNYVTSLYKWPTLQKKNMSTQ